MCFYNVGAVVEKGVAGVKRELEEEVVSADLGELRKEVAAMR